MLWKRNAEPRARCRAASKGPVRAQLKPRDGKGELGWSGGKAGASGAERQDRAIARSADLQSHARALPPHSVLLVHLQLLQLQPRPVRGRAEGSLRRGARARDPDRRAGGARRHDLLRRRDAVAARAGGDRAARSTACRERFDVARRRRDHARDQSRNRRRASGMERFPRGRCQSHQLRCAVVPGRGAAPARPDPLGRSRARRRCARRARRGSTTSAWIS